MYGIFVNENGHTPYAQLIVKGFKTIETRNKNMLKSLVGERVAVVSTRNGRNPLVVGYVDIVTACFCSAFAFDFYRDGTCIPVGSTYDVHGKGKWMYFLNNPEKCNPFFLPSSAVRHGRSWCEFEV